MPIAPALAEILNACPIDARSDLVFASPRTGGLISGRTQITKRANKAASGTFHLHDLRRTFKTGLSRLGIDLETAELALGYARSDLVQIYNRDKAEDVLRKAFEAWTAHVKKIVAEEEARQAVGAEGVVFG